MRNVIAVSVLAAAVAAQPASAQERMFDGPSVTVIAGLDVNTKNLPEDSSGVLYGAQAGYDLRRGQMVFGVEGEITGSSSDKCVAQTGAAPMTTNTYCAKAGRDLYLGGRLGVVIGRSTLLYGKVGYTNAQLRQAYFYSAASPNPAFDYSVRAVYGGVRFGGGIEQAVSRNVSFKAEYRYSRYGYSFDRHQSVAGIAFRF